MIEEGDIAPSFTLEGSDGKRHSLAEYRGKFVVLYFYPKDLTPGCSVEAQEFNALQREFDKMGAIVIGLSRDSVSSHLRFIAKYGLGFLLLSDGDGKVHREYGVTKAKTLFGHSYVGTVRSTFLIDPDGKIAKAMYGVNPKANPGFVCSFLKKSKKA